MKAPIFASVFPVASDSSSYRVWFFIRATHDFGQNFVKTVMRLGIKESN